MADKNAVLSHDTESFVHRMFTLGTAMVEVQTTIFWFMVENDINTSTSCNLLTHMHIFLYKQLHFRSAESQIFDDYSNLASNSRASNQKFLATFEPQIGYFA